MATHASAHEVFEHFQHCHVTQDWNGLDAILAHDAVLDLPFAAPGVERLHHGRAAFREATRGLWSRAPLRIEAFADLVLHAGADPERLFASYDVVGSEAKSGEAFRFPFAAWLVIRDGRIHWMRQYDSPLAMAKATRRALDLAAHLLGEPIDDDCPESCPAGRADGARHVVARAERGMT